MVNRLSIALLAAIVLLCGLAVGNLVLYRKAMGDGIDGVAVFPLSFVNTDGQQVTMAAGQPMVIEIFANWCEFSAYQARYVLPGFERYVTAHGGRIVGVDETNRLGIGEPGSFGHPASGKDGTDDASAPHSQAAFLATLRTYAQNFHLTMPLLYDPQEVLDKRLRFYLGSSLAYPTFVYFAANGQFITRAEGVQSLTALVTTYDEVASLH